MKPASTVENLEAYFIREGFENEQRGRFYRLGIDARYVHLSPPNNPTLIVCSLWFHQVQSTFAVGHAQSGENPELRTLFYRLERLLRLPVHAVFVFDGPDRPPMKRGRRVVPTGHWMVDAMKEMIVAFGYVFHNVSSCCGSPVLAFTHCLWKAPAEAEAELALLNQMGHVDAVLTDDSDTFLFGAHTVIRK